MASRLKIEEEQEGDIVETTDIFFEKIGEAVPIRSQEDPQFDLQSPPSQPLAVSQHHRLLFLVHSSGFLVARTKDVIDLAKDIKEKRSSSTIEDLSFVDVPVGKVNLLALSTADESTLAVSVAADILFFNVDSILNKDIKPFSTSSLPQSSLVKDFKWRKKNDDSFVVLSKDRKLYRGTPTQPLKHVMDDVDAVEWSLKGAYVAVARDNSLNILSSKFNEKLCMTLSLRSEIGDSNDERTVKVDTMKWIRPDCIILGCFTLSQEGKEENYFVQVVKSNAGKITDATSGLVVLSFSDLFAGLVDDIVPRGTGPYLFLSYLEQCELAIAANRKNTDQHIVLFSWSLGETGEASLVDIQRDNWLPRIELQDNGDDNLIMGLCIDKVSLFGNVKVQLGVEEVKELSPYCVLMCLTLEGKLILFHIASATENAVPPDLTAVSDNEEDSPAVVAEEFDLPKFTCGQGEQKSEQVVSSLPIVDKCKMELVAYGSSEIPLKSETNLCQTNVNSAAHATVEAFHKDDIPRSVFLENSHSFEAIGQIKPPTTKLFLEASDQLKLHFGQLGENLGQSFLKTSPLEGPGNKVGDSSQMGTQKIAGYGSSTSILGKFPNDTSTQLNHDNMPKKFELVKDSVGKTGSNGFQSMQFQAWPNPASQSSGGKFMVSQESDARSSFPPLTHIQNNKSLASSVTLDAANLPSSNVGKPSLVKDTSGTSFTVNKFSGAPPDIGTQKSSIGAGKIESVPLIHGSQLAPQLNFAVEKSPNQMLHTPKDAYKSSTQSGMLKSEPHLPKQFSNIKEMAKELDTLLESIEETGGYRDACTVSLKSSVEVLEQGIAFLSEKCWRRKNMMDEQLGKTQHLLDKSVQVLARKIYIEGIVKQASDSQYWDLWNRQKLSPELELKQRHILKLNQDLTNQLIELERHFNNFELHKFGDNYEMDAGRRALQSKFGHSRHIQSLHTLYNTTNTQLAAAEQLSECLSQQMAVLSVESPVKKQNVKKELFETLGIAYDASFTSPDASKPSNASSMDKLVLSSGSSISRNQSRRKQSSALKSFDTDITRRRRESLDQSWTSFEPPKTTVKRMLLQESPSLKRSSFTDMHNSSPYAPGRSKSSLSKEWTATSATLYQSGNEGIQDAFRKQESETTLFTWANSSLVQPQSAGLKSSTGQTNNFSALASTSGSHPMVVQNHSWETSTTTIAKPNSGASHLERSIISCFNENEIHSTLQHRPSQDLSISQVASLAKKSTDIPNSDGQRTVLSNSTVGGEKQVSSTTKCTLFGSSSNHDLQFKPPAAASTSPNLSEKVSHFNVVMGKSQPRETLSESSSVSKQVSDIAPLTFSSSTSSLSSSLSTMPTTSLTSISPSVSVSTSTTIGSSSAPKFSLSTSFPMVPTKSSTTQFSESMTTATLDANKKAQFPSSSALVSISSVFSSPHSSPFSSSSFFIQPPQTSLPSPADLAPVSTVSETLNKDVDSTRVSPPLQSELPAIELSLKPQSAVSSAPINETPTIVSAGNQMSTIDISSPAPSLASNTQPVQLSTGTGDILLKAPLSASISTADGKSESLDVTVSQEDEMEEEAPETNQRTEFSLGSLSSFGIGSTPNPTAAQPNPFGAPFGIVSATTASSSFSATVPSGELFKPASFSFQSPQPSQSAQPSSFASTTPGQPPAHGAFGQPAQLGAGQQALGSVLGAFGQSRQFGTGLQGGGFASASGFGGGFSGSQSAGGFSNAATGGFVGISSNNGGFAALATGGGGFASMASGGGGGGFGGLGSGGGGFGGLGSGGGFTTAAPGISGFGAAASGGAGGGFGGAASAGGGFAGAASGGGFGAFGSQQGSGGFSAFGGGGAQTGKPPELFTQMRK